MKILIVGSEGFIGRHCVSYFSKLGHTVYEADVLEISRPMYTRIQKSSASFEPLFRDMQYDVCINASGSAHVGFSFDHPAIDFELNVVNVNKLLVSIRTHNPGCRFLNFSSAAVYGNPVALPVKEDMPKNPLSPYGFHKLQSEYLLKEYHRFFGVATCSLRVFSAYGPGLRKQLFWDLRERAKQEQVVSLFGNGSETRDFIFIDDLMEAVRIIIEKAPFDGGCYNVASGVEVKISDAVAAFLKNLDPTLSFAFSNKQKQGDPDNWVANISWLNSWGFKPAFTIESGLQLTAAWMKQIE